jgi:hypothetical protein
MLGVPEYSADPKVVSRVGNVIGETASQEERHVRATGSVSARSRVDDLRQQLSHIPLTDRLVLLWRQPKFSTVGGFVSSKLFTVCRAVEGEAHPIERETLLRLLAVEQRRAWNVVVSHDCAPHASWRMRSTLSAAGTRTL